MYSDSPFLFIDVPEGRETLKGTSFYNEAEIELVSSLTTFCLKIFDQTNKLHKKHPIIPLQKFTKNSIYVITPYNAQKNAIAELFSDIEIEDQVLSIDSSQGREFDLVFVSMVRTSPGDFIQQYNRINVGITRAKHGLVIIGNARTLRQDKGWAKLLSEKRANTVSGINGAKHWITNEVNTFLKRVTAPAQSQESG